MKNTEKLRILKRFGLSENEAVIYIEILKNEELLPYQISKLTNIPRTTVYDVLMDLSFKGLVELEKSNGLQKQQTKVRAKNPSVLRKILQEQREESFKTEALISEILPELKGYFHKEESNANFKFYPGIEGIKKVYLEDDEYSDIEIEEYSWRQLMPHDVFGSANMNKDIHGRTKSNKLHAKELVPLNDWTKHVISYQFQLNKSYLQNREFRAIDEQLFQCFIEFAIRGDYIKISSAHDSEMWGLTIRSESLSKTLKSIFMLTWQMATPITKEMIETWGDNGFLKAQRDLNLEK